MSSIRPILPLLLLLLFPLYIRGNSSNGGEDQKIDRLMSLVQAQANSVNDLTTLVKALTETVRTQGEIIRDQEKNVRVSHKSLDKRLREIDLKIECALTDGTLAPRNTSGMMAKVDEALSLLKEVHGYIKPATCAQIHGGLASGVYQIYPNYAYPVSARCERSNGGGWTVIQKRFDGSVDFFRGWEEYAEGFGDPAGEYWLGLRHIHALTKGQRMELYVGLTYFDQVTKYAKYSSFSVSREEDKFRLWVGGYSGTTVDGLQYHNFQPFSTKDQDNDGENCSNRFHGAWWYDNCFHSNLNGLFSKAKVTACKYMNWNNDYGTNPIKASVMMIRPSKFAKSLRSRC